MPDTERTGTRRATLYVRSDLPTPASKRRAAITARLEQLVETGAVDSVSIVEWNKHVPISGERGAFERDRYNEFSEWARDAGVCLAPFFDTRECYSFRSGDCRTELVLPALCLAVREDDRLRTVAPHASGTDTETIEDCISRLAHAATGTTTRRTPLTTAD
ncbi:MAG: HTH domain-containing protein [Haloarculaceae archaeon]